MEKYLYFRTQQTIGSDDGADDSVVFPLSSFLGAFPSAADTFEMRFKPVKRVASDGQDGNVINADKVVVSLSTNNTFKKVIGDLLKAIYRDEGFSTDGSSNFIVVADDLSTNPKYLVDGISGLSTISVGADQS